MSIAYCRRLSVFFFLSIVLACSIFPIKVSEAQGIFPTSQQKTETFQKGELLIRFKTGVSAQSEMFALGQYGATFERQLYASDVKLAKVPEGSELDIASKLNSDPAVLYAEPNFFCRSFVTPNDPYYNSQWAHDKIQSASAWDISTGSDTIVIAILDSGIDETHPDLMDKIIAGYDFVDNDSDPHDLNGHGTHVAGIAAAVTNNSVGIAGVSWEAKIMPIRVLGEDGYGTTESIVNGINWACQHGAYILNMSLGGYSFSQTQQDAITACHTAGKMIVAAMGNDDTDTPAYPAANTNVLAVSATGRTDARAGYSNFGSHCDIAAPGGVMSYYHDPNGIRSTMPIYSVYLTTTPYSYYKNYDYLQGTSQAAPHVAGLAALIWSTNTELTPDQVQGIIQDTAVDLGSTGWDQYYGHGLIDALAALQGVPMVECAGCSGETVTLTSRTYPSGTNCECLAATSITIGSGVIVESGANVIFKAPQVYIKSGAVFQNGSTVEIKQP